MLVTGGTGFIGSNLVACLQELNHEVWVTGNPASEASLPEGVKIFPHGPSGVDWDHMKHLLRDVSALARRHGHEHNKKEEHKHPRKAVKLVIDEP